MILIKKNHWLTFSIIKRKEWVQESQFLSGAHDSQIALWDVSKPSTPIQLFKSHNGIINDLSHNANATSIFGSVANDYTAQIQDTRSSLEDEPAIQIRYSHHQNSILFHPDIPTLVATGGKDNIVSLYDLRNTNEPVRKFFGHVDSVVGIKWDNIYDPSSLISWGLDNRVIIWDLNQLDEPFTYPTNDANETNSRRKAKQAEDPCLKFVHGGHTNRINDIDIHPKLKNVFITAGDDHLLEIWKPKTIIVEDDDQEEKKKKLETKKMPIMNKKMMKKLKRTPKMTLPVGIKMATPKMKRTKMLK
ncbi:hypothetical protein QCA50_017145 [Cerrena zonata]|uniref:Uncharacterized protein n=1 Tax=Cerrena zonata TaxID=2478898 RepID=A0AAW0FLJ3_9APHY